jgi:(2Fe-2S) ferredoxin
MNTIDAAFSKMGLDSSQKHVFLCVGPECCSPDAGLATWEVLKKETARLGVPCLRSKAACLRICTGGPWMVVYPEGIWYGHVTPEKCLRIVQEHLAEGTPIQEEVVREHPLA